MTYLNNNNPYIKKKHHRTTVKELRTNVDIPARVFEHFTHFEMLQSAGELYYIKMEHYTFRPKECYTMITDAIRHTLQLKCYRHKVSGYRLVNIIDSQSYTARVCLFIVTTNKQFASDIFNQISLYLRAPQIEVSLTVPPNRLHHKLYKEYQIELNRGHHRPFATLYDLQYIDNNPYRWSLDNLHYTPMTIMMRLGTQSHALSTRTFEPRNRVKHICTLPHKELYLSTHNTYNDNYFFQNPLPYKVLGFRWRKHQTFGQLFNLTQQTKKLKK